MSNTPEHAYIPPTCSAPPGPTDNNGGPYFNWPGGNNAFGVYVPPGWYVLDPGGSDSERSVAALFNDPDPDYQPPLPPWIQQVCDPDANGNYWYAGGYMPPGKYMCEGWYKPSEFYG